MSDEQYCTVGSTGRKPVQGLYLNTPPNPKQANSTRKPTGQTTKSWDLLTAGGSWSGFKQDLGEDFTSGSGQEHG
jgi:hypothetical protein